MTEDSLKSKTLKGVAWSGIDNVAQYTVSFVVSIILARLLSPDDYGLLGIIAIFTAISTALVNGGFTNALIRKKECTESDYSTAFLVNMFMSILLYIIIFICSPLIAIFFERDELVLLTQISSIGIIIGALSLVQQTRLTKKIDFKTQTKITLIVSIMSGLVGIGMAFLGFGVWSLVIQGLLAQLLRTALLWHFTRWMPSMKLSIDSFKELFGFGWKIMVSGLLDTVWKEMNQVVVGKFYNSASLGQYTRANQFSQLFSSNLTGVIQRVTFPVLSDIQDDKVRMVSAYRHIIKTTMFFSSISMFSLGAVAEPLLYCLIGPKWHDAATYLPLICLAGSLYPLHSINLNMLQVQGRSDLFLGLEITKKIIAIGPLMIGAFCGIIPMLWTCVLVGILSFFLNSYYSGKLLDYSSWRQIMDVLPSYGVASAAALIMYFVKYLPVSYWIVLPIQLVLGMFAIVLICEFAKLEEYKETKMLFITYGKKLLKKM